MMNVSLKTLMPALFAVLFCFSINTYGQQNEETYGFSIGGQLLSPAGISIKADLNPDISVSGLFSFRAAESNSSVYLQGNVLKHVPFQEQTFAEGELSGYFGAGLITLIADDFDAGIRFPAGLEFRSRLYNLNTYADLAPTLMVADEFSFAFSSSLGIRFYID